MAKLSPKELYDRYRQGFSGCLWEQHIYDRLLEESKYGYFSDGAKRIKGSGKGKLSTPYKSVLKFDKNPYNERQTTGDCLVRGTTVLMSDGSIKNIEDIEIGDSVITHHNRSKQVYELINKKPSEEQINHIYIKKYDKNLSMTNDHKMLTFNDNGYEWIEAKNLKEGDLLVLPKTDQVDLYGDQVYKIYPELSLMTKVKVKQNKLTCSLGLLAPITKITKERYTDNVYCINVQDDHSFIANGLISHNCVSHATRNACDVSRAVEIDLHNEKESWIARGATEGIYGARGWAGQGMSCSRAAEFVSKIGGILVRKDYKGVVDLTKYNGNLGAGWGGRGLPDKVLDLANDHQIQTVSLIKTIEEARDALSNGYGLAVCSSYGFSSTRDKKGFAKTSGNWAHAMAWIACDDTNGDLSFLVQNSWGKWNDGGHPNWGKIPDGSFLIHSDVAAGMLSQNGAYAFSNFDGFPVQKLPNYGFDSYL